MERRKQIAIVGAAALALIVVVVLVVAASRPKNPYADIGPAPVIEIPTSTADASATPESKTPSASVTATGNATGTTTGGSAAGGLGDALDEETQKMLADPKNKGKKFILRGVNGKIVAIPDDGSEGE